MSIINFLEATLNYITAGRVMALIVFLSHFFITLITGKFYFFDSFIIGLLSSLAITFVIYFIYFLILLYYLLNQIIFYTDQNFKYDLLLQDIQYKLFSGEYFKNIPILKYIIPKLTNIKFSDSSEKQFFVISIYMALTAVFIYSYKNSYPLYTPVYRRVDTNP